MAQQKQAGSVETHTCVGAGPWASEGVGAPILHETKPGDVRPVECTVPAIVSSKPGWTLNPEPEKRQHDAMDVVGRAPAGPATCRYRPIGRVFATHRPALTRILAGPRLTWG